MAIGLSRKIGNGRTFFLRNIQASRLVSNCARPTANVGTRILPRFSTVSFTMRTNSSTVSRERPMVVVAVGGFEEDQVGVLERLEVAAGSARLRGPRSPENTTRFCRPSSSTINWMLAEPSMWPASAQMAWMPGATGTGCW